MNVGLLGIGTVGGAFYKLALEQGNINVKSLLSRRERPGLECRVTSDINDIINDPEIDCVVEVLGGLHPAYEYISAALKAGKSVVTANKAVVCEYYDEFLDLAKSSGSAFRCTAAAGGGIPWLESLSRISQLDEIDSIEGILNGTTNFILSAMTNSGADYAESLKEAQRLGYAEADPTADVEGFDAMRKVVISANVAFGVSVPKEDVPCFGISTCSSEDIKAFGDAGKVCKLIGHASKKDDRISACVEPMLFDKGSATAGIEGGYNIITLKAKRVMTQSFIGLGAGGDPTGANVLADCISIAKGAKGFYTDKAVRSSVDNSVLKQNYYVRTSAEIPFEITGEMGSGAITGKVSVSDMHAFASKVRKHGGSIFIAAIGE